MAGYNSSQPAEVAATKTVTATFQFLSGWSSEPHAFKVSDRIYALASHIKQVKGLQNAGLPQLSQKGNPLPAGMTVSELSDFQNGVVLDVLQSKFFHSLPEGNARDSANVLPSRLPPSQISVGL